MLNLTPLTHAALLLVTDIISNRLSLRLRVRLAAKVCVRFFIVLPLPQQLLTPEGFGSLGEVVDFQTERNQKSSIFERNLQRTSKEETKWPVYH